MDFAHLLIKIVVAIVCAGLATMLLPRRPPGHFAGLIVIGLVGVWLGEWGFALLRQRFGLSLPLLYWQIEGVLLIPAIVGCMVVLYVLTTFLSWGRYTNR